MINKIRQYYDSQILRETDLTSAALWRLRLSSIFALLSLPVITALDYLTIFKPTGFLGPILLIFIVFAGSYQFMFSRISSLFYRSKSKMDEWEKDIRTSAESFTYRVASAVMIAIFLIIVLSINHYGLSAVLIPGEIMLYVIGNLLLLMMMLPAAFIVWTQKPLDQV